MVVPQYSPRFASTESTSGSTRQDTPRTREESDVRLVQALGSCVLRAQEEQTALILEQGRRLELALDKQQDMLDALGKQVSGIQAVAPNGKVLKLPLVSSEPKSKDQVDSATEMGTASDSQQQQHQLQQPAHRESPKPPRNTQFHPLVQVVGKEESEGDKSPTSPLNRFSKLMERPRTEAPLRVPKVCMANVVTSNAFGIFIALMVCINTLFIFLQSDHAARNPQEETPAIYGMAETTFLAVFAVEILLRIWVYRREFFLGEECRWNAFDTIIVTVASFEELMKLIQTGGTFIKQATVLRAMRILRISRIIRMVRILRIFRDLRIMVASIIATMMTLFWALVCLVMIMLAFATLFLTVTTDYRAEHGPQPHMEEYFGSMPVMLLSLFQMTTGGFDWRDMSDILWVISPLSVGALCLYMSMMQYAIMNILTGICCNTAHRTAEDDFEISIHEERVRQDAATAKLRKVFHAADVQNQGTITWKQLDSHLGNQAVLNCFKRLDLERWHLQSFFELLPQTDEREPAINIDRFIRGCMRLRCNVKNIDLAAFQFDNQEGRRILCDDICHKVDSLQSSLMALQSQCRTDKVCQVLN